MKSALLFLLLASCSPPPHVVVIIQDPNNVATDATQLFVGLNPDQLTHVELNSALQFPSQITVSVATNSDHEIIVEARTDIETLARGSEIATFARRGKPRVTVVLEAACVNDDECDDGEFCTGAEACTAGVCAAGTPPCGANVNCASSTCVELGGGSGVCNTTVDHDLCDPGSYCNPVRGCVQGQGCQDDIDCRDDFECNGEELCVNLVCTPGLPPVVNDADLCTLDGCDDSRPHNGLDAIFHVPQTNLDGIVCTIPDSGPPPIQGVCVSSKDGCAASECGDGVIDVHIRGEVCDDGVGNSDDWSLDATCLTNCSGWGSYCGDGTQDSDEGCDDGVRADTQNGCSDTCQDNHGCGNGRVELIFEECDDADGDNCDGCLTDCTAGCICAAPGACLGSTWCNGGACVACDVATHCGAKCLGCSDPTPLCGGVSAGCVCNPDPAPHGSCGLGSWCQPDGSCAPCSVAEHCGQDCVACSTPATDCGGAEDGCVAPSCAGLPDSTRCQVTTVPERAFDICMAGVCVSPGQAEYPDGVDRSAMCLDDGVADDEWCCNSPPSFVPSDTNVRDCYDNTTTLSSCLSCGGFCGQDAQYGWDTLHAEAERFTRTELVVNEPTATDTATGLIWEACTHGARGWDCDAGAAAAMSWWDGVASCDSLVWAGYADWRLPNEQELQSILDFSTMTPSIDPVAFPATPPSAWFWTSTSRASNPTVEARFVSFFDGYTASWQKTFNTNVRCVRGGTSLQVPHFSRTELVTDEPVVADSATGLVWQGCVAGLSGASCPGDTRCTSAGGDADCRDWEASLAYCESLDWDDKTDWRLPDINELRSISDGSRTSPAVDPVAFPGTPSPANIWSSTTNVTPHTSAWTVRLSDGGPTTSGKGGGLHIRCVRTGG